MHLLKTLASSVAVLSSALGALAYPGPGLVNGDTAHDPSIARGADGTYVMAATGNGIPIWTSPDRTTWTLRGPAFPDGAPKATETYTKTVDGDLWAPDVTFVDGKFIMYYSASTFSKQDSAIFMAQSTTGLPGTWTDNGKVLSSKEGDAYNAIDPNLIITSAGRWYLSFGSFWQGIYLVELNSKSGKVSSTNGGYVHIAGRNGSAIEAPWIIETNGFYYLFTSWDKCCSGTASTYNIRVTRSSNGITGPYRDRTGVDATAGGGTLVLESHDDIKGPGGQSLLKDADAIALIYHYYTSLDSQLGINLLDFSSGWPVVY
ncbi:hypothetical protein JCM6882_002310 [Rhodosporidiobolus microsporus]